MISDEICLSGVSGKMGSGKDTIAEMLVEYSNIDFVLNSFGRTISHSSRKTLSKIAEQF